MDDLLTYVREELQRRRGEWTAIAEAVPGLSYSWIRQVGSGSYNSQPSYSRLRTLALYLRKTRRGLTLRRPPARQSTRSQ